MRSVDLGIDMIVGTTTVIHMEYSAMAAGDMDSLDTIIDCHKLEVHCHILARVHHHKVLDYTNRTCFRKIKRQLLKFGVCIFYVLFLDRLKAK